MNCSQLEYHAIAYLDGKLARSDAAAVRSHLADCAACAERLQGFSHVSELLDGWEAMRPSVSFNASLQQRILAEPVRQLGWLDRIPQWLQGSSFGKPALAGALLGMMLIAVVLTRYSPAPATSSSIAARSASPAMIAATVEGNDELTLYQDLPVLEDLELLTNFEVLQEFETSAQ